MSDIELKVKEIQDSAIEALKNADGLEKLNEIRVSFLGKKGSLTQVLKSMKTVAPEDRPKVGKWVNDARFAIEEKMEETQAEVLCHTVETRESVENWGGDPIHTVEVTERVVETLEEANRTIAEQKDQIAEMEHQIAELKEMGIELMVSVWPMVDYLSENFEEMKTAYEKVTSGGNYFGLHIDEVNK